MLLDLDIYRVARALIHTHGDEAPIHGTQRASASLETGDVKGWADWLEIMCAAETLLSQRTSRSMRSARNAL